MRRLRVDSNSNANCDCHGDAYAETYTSAEIGAYTKASPDAGASA